MVWVAIPNKDLFRILLRPSQPASTDRNVIRRVKIICRNSAIRRFVNKTFCVEILRWTTPSFLRMSVKTWWYLPPPQGHWVSIQEKNQKGEKFFTERSKAGQRELFLSLIFLSCAVNPFLLCRMTMAMNQVQARIRYLEQFFAFFAPNVLPERSSEVGINDLGSPNLVNSSLLQTKVQLGWKSTIFFSAERDDCVV